MTVVDRRDVVEYLVDELGRSERKACALTSRSRATQRYSSTRTDDPRLQERLVSLASERRFRYPRLHMMLRRDGFAVGRRRVFRLYRTPGLKLRSKRRRNGTRAPRGWLPASASPNEHWSMDFLSDQLCDGRTIRVLTIVDEYSKLCPALEVDTSLSGVRVGRMLDRAIERSGTPRLIVMDNGLESTSNALDQ